MPLSTLINHLAGPILVGAATAAGEFIQKDYVSLPTVLSVVAVVWLGGRKFQKLIDRVEAVERKIGDLPCRGEPVRVHNKDCTQ